MSRLSDGPFGSEGKKLSELSDQELREERARRRGERLAEEPAPALDRVRQYLGVLGNRIHRDFDLRRESARRVEPL